MSQNSCQMSTKRCKMNIVDWKCEKDMFRRIFRKEHPKEWKTLLLERVDIMKQHFMNTKKTCANIDFRTSFPFFKQELMRAHEIVDMIDDRGKIICFAVLKTFPSHVYLILVSSFRKGCGRDLLFFLKTSSNYSPARFVVMRSIDSATPFYLREGCYVFDWNTTESYIHGGNAKFTEAIQRMSINDAREYLFKHNILHEKDQEIPFLLPRQASPKVTTSRKQSLRSSLDLPSLREET